MNTAWEDAKLTFKITVGFWALWWSLGQIFGAAFAMELKRADLVGEWAYVSTFNQFPDGRQVAFFGEKPVGRFIIMPSGRYSHIIGRSDLEDVTSGSIRDMTPAEQQRIAQGSLSHFGTYAVDEKAGTFTGFVEWASFPNIKDEDQLRTVTKINRDELHYTNHLSVAGVDAKVVAVLRRLGPVAAPAKGRK